MIREKLYSHPTTAMDGGSADNAGAFIRLHMGTHVRVIHQVLVKKSPSSRASFSFDLMPDDKQSLPGHELQIHGVRSARNSVSLTTLTSPYSRVGQLIKRKIKNPQHDVLRVLYLMPDDDLLSHGETPHYHRRYVVSLLSSEWNQVVPTLYVRQAIRYEMTYTSISNLVAVKDRVLHGLTSE